MKVFNAINSFEYGKGSMKLLSSIYPLLNISSKNKSHLNNPPKHFISNLSEITHNFGNKNDLILETEPKQLRPMGLIKNINPVDLKSGFYEKLSKAHSNPRTILKLYREYASLSDSIDYPWLIRAFGQLGNIFGFNSFWSTRDKQLIKESFTFKHMIYDIIIRKQFLRSKHVPRILYSMACLEYRIIGIFPLLLEHIEKNIKLWKSSTLSNMVVSLSFLGIEGYNRRGNSLLVSNEDFSDIISIMIQEIYARSKVPKQAEEMSNFCWASLGYAIVLLGRYEEDPEILPHFLSLLNVTTGSITAHGWIQFYLYMILYCAAVEKPGNETEIKNSIPVEIQQILQDRWISEIILRGQNQGSELLQLEVDNILNDLKQDSIMNCSFGRPLDTQHAFFCGHLLKSRNLVFEYDYYNPIGPGDPKLSGQLQCKKRILNKLGFHLVVIHKCFWHPLETHDKIEEIVKILSQFPMIPNNSAKVTDCYEQKESFDRYLKHMKKHTTSWPPDKVIV